MMLTIFTPVFNRAYIIDALYKSLCAQTSKDFEWLVVDDGSSDNIKEVMDRFMADGKIHIRFFSQSNGGKHRAINHGLQLARGDLFFIVDSDDTLEYIAVERIKRYSALVKDDCIGLCFHKCYMDRGIIGNPFPKKEMLSTSLEMTYRYDVKGDRAEVFRTEVLRRFQFPTFRNENFVPEALIWNRLSVKYKLLFVDEAIYLCEYLPDGLTANFKKNLQRNPNGFGLYYRELLGYKIVPLWAKLKALIRVFQCCFYSKCKVNFNNFCR